VRVGTPIGTYHSFVVSRLGVEGAAQSCA